MKGFDNTKPSNPRFVPSHAGGPDISAMAQKNAESAQFAVRNRISRVVMLGQSFNGIDDRVSAAREAARVLIEENEQLRETQGRYKRKIAALKKTLFQLQRAHTLMKHWVSPRKRPRVVCLIGSVARAAGEFDATTHKLSLDGVIVLGPASLHRELDDWARDAVMELHRNKIRLADEVHVLNPLGYIGEHTRELLELARVLGKKVTWMQPPAVNVAINDPPAPSIPRRDPAPAPVDAPEPSLRKAGPPRGSPGARRPVLGNPW